MKPKNKQQFELVKNCFSCPFYKYGDHEVSDGCSINHDISFDSVPEFYACTMIHDHCPLRGLEFYAVMIE